MDKQLLVKIKPILQTCNPDNFESVKKKLMQVLKPEEADQVYEYYTSIDPDFVPDTCKVNTFQVIPKYNDYFGETISSMDIVRDCLSDDYEDYD